MDIKIESELIVASTDAKTALRHDSGMIKRSTTPDSTIDDLMKKESCEFDTYALADIKHEELNIKDEDPFPDTTDFKESKVTEKKQKHIEKQEEPKEGFQCHDCNKIISSKGGLSRHRKIHTGEKPHSCNVCEFKFSRRDQLRNHLRTHTGEKPYNCTACGNKFALSSDLTRHMRIHTEEAPYVCSFCYYKSKTKRQLNNHLMLHTGQELHRCTLCDHKRMTAAQFKVHFTNNSCAGKLCRCSFCDYKSNKVNYGSKQ